MVVLRSEGLGFKEFQDIQFVYNINICRCNIFAHV